MTENPRDVTIRFSRDEAELLHQILMRVCPYEARYHRNTRFHLASSMEEKLKLGTLLHPLDSERAGDVTGRIDLLELTFE